jgi:pSer/pThr/pTyr-binding forkhead associated (FHA) protein
MNPDLLLLVIRLGSAIILLAILGLIFWFLYQDVQSTRQTIAKRFTRYGRLRVLTNANGSPGVDTVFDLSPVTTIGRNPRNSIVLDDGYVSGEHALLVWREDQWWLEDLDSRNGTILNDSPLNGPVVISPGDVLTIGNIQLKLEDWNEPEQNY